MIFLRKITKGCFISRDPLGYVDGLGLHEAFGGNPGNAVDPWGLFDLPKLTEQQEKAKDMFIHVSKYQSYNDVQLKEFYTTWLDAFADPIRKAAKKNQIPPWLLSAVILGEVTAMGDESIRDKIISERTRENWGIGKSVGMAQITVATAVKYGLTPEAIKYQSSKEALDKLWPNSKAAHDAFKALIRMELLNPILNIEASAKYLRALICQARKKGKIENDFGKFDFSKLSDPNTMFIDIAGMAVEEAAMQALVGFFGAAHNDDSLGPFSEGIGKTQGANAETVMDALIRFGLIEKYGLKDQ